MRRFIMSQELPMLDPLAAFVDVGSEHMHVSVGGNTPEVFGTVTSQLHALRDWLAGTGRTFRCDGSDRRVLAAVVRCTGKCRSRSAHGQWPADAQPAWQEDRHG